MKRAIIPLLLLLPLWTSADSGVLIPSDSRIPDASRLSIAEMKIDVRIDNGMARVAIREIFANHTATILEGSYSFALPVRAVISDFAVWDGLTRIPGVILERKRAEQIYDSFRRQSIDPGLLRQGDDDADVRASEFTARVTPIPPWGTKRVELEYHERALVEQFDSVISVPLKPAVYAPETVGKLEIEIEVVSKHALSGFETVGTAYPLHVAESTANRIRASYSGTNVALTQDLGLKYRYAPEAADTLSIDTWRRPSDTIGFFQASALFANGAAPQNAPPRTVIAVLDTSLSMQWDKLDTSFNLLEMLLRSLRPADRFDVLLFNSEVTAFTPLPQAADRNAVDRALAFVRQSALRGGTNLDAALDRALAMTSAVTGSQAYIVLLTDGGATEASVKNAGLEAAFSAKWRRKPAAERPRLFVFGVGSDANIPLLRRLGSLNGVFEWATGTESADFKITQFLAKIGRFPIANLHLTISPASAIAQVYPLEDTAFGGSQQVWIGQYKTPSPSVKFAAAGERDGKAVELTAAAVLPQDGSGSPELPRTWAKARVDALLDKIDRDGEDTATIEEIIELSRRYKFVTPYTSFLAAPRSLLRPRLIQPGDPILRVKTDPSIKSVIAVFPFGTIEPLRYLKDENVWQTRFLAPPDMTDGTWPVRLILRDDAGRAFREEKTFVIASHPPTLRVTLDRASYRRGDTVALRASASATTRSIVARLDGAAPASLRWSANARSNIGTLRIPDDLPAGSWTIAVTAEDFAHNIGSTEVKIAVLP